MRALTLWQPWASQVFDRDDPKDVENRKTLRPSKELLGSNDLFEPVERPFFAVHAGLVYDCAPWNFEHGWPDGVSPRGWAFPKGARVPSRERCPVGAVLGIARVRHCWDSTARSAFGVEGVPAGFIEAESMPLARWWLGPIGWRLFDVVPLAEPVLCRGALGLWALDDARAERVRREALLSVTRELEGRAYAGAPGHAEHYVRRMPRLDVADLARISAMLETR